MKLDLKQPLETLNSTYRRANLGLADAIIFQNNLSKLLDGINEKETEENQKNIVIEFLKNTYYKDLHEVNTKGRQDLVIHNDKTAKSSVGVIIEVKRTSNKSEMISAQNPNAKALHELLHYYLKERFINNNKEIKHLVITNVYEWYVFDGADFERFFFENKQLKEDYKNWTDGKLGINTTEWFYKEIAKPFLEDKTLECTYFDIRKLKEILASGMLNNTLSNALSDTSDALDTPLRREDEMLLIDIYKMFSPEHLLKLSVLNDANTLNTAFYNELLHILGVEETGKNKKLITRIADPKNRNQGSLLENAISNLLNSNEYDDYPNIKQFGDTANEQVFSFALELCITWLNRILFLKLLEGQLLKYHKKDPQRKFLQVSKIKDFAELDTLFFRVLAIPIGEREKYIAEKFGDIPYLNSSLFDATDVEIALKIKDLDSFITLPIFGATVLKDDNGKRITGKSDTLKYLFEFLDAFDFASDAEVKLQQNNKTIINAAVLGLIFEKINGYKDGSVFTPSFITMYMCRESIRRAVIQKFNEEHGWNCADFIELHNVIDKISKKQANETFNKLKICDPAVGSGHFLVSALNEMIVIKHELQILVDSENRRIKSYSFDVEDDELVITDEDNKVFVYNFRNPESQRLQETLFNEKQIIIENCLFGVDINPKSVLICRLRLWIELLKNMYYTQESKFQQLETLPNIDINIKAGNSLLSRFDIKNDNFDKFPNFIKKIDEYKFWSGQYKNATDRKLKKQLLKQMKEFKTEFKQRDSNIITLDKKIAKFSQELVVISSLLFGKITENDAKKIARLENQIEKAAQDKAIIIENNLHENPFEWRYEFPEVLDENGDFVGFDLVIGNPPYIKEYENKNAFNGLRDSVCYQGKMDLWYLFGNLALSLVKPNHCFSYIATNNWVTNAGASNFRAIMMQNTQIISLIDFGAFMVFDSAAIQTMVMNFRNTKEPNEYEFDYRRLGAGAKTLKEVKLLLAGSKEDHLNYLRPTIIRTDLLDKKLTFNNNEGIKLLAKIKEKHNFFLREKTYKVDKKQKIYSELGQGIVAPQDFVNHWSEDILQNNAKKGDGIFILSQKELEEKAFSDKEKEIIKPYFSTTELQGYYGDSANTKWIIYTKPEVCKPNKKTKEIPIDDCPKIKEHLDKFETVITSSNKPYGLHRAREQQLFEGKKIFVQRKCPIKPVFTYTDFDCYVSQTFFIIKTARINLRYLTGLLNSKLVAFWLRSKGKMQGNAYQLDKEPLLEIPIYKPTDKEAKKIADLVDAIITQKAAGLDSLENERKIDVLVYDLYEITAEEQKIIETK